MGVPLPRHFLHGQEESHHVCLRYHHSDMSQRITKAEAAAAAAASPSPPVHPEPLKRELIGRHS